METFHFEDYFENMDNKYYSPEQIIALVEKVLGANLSEIKDRVCNAKVTVTEAEIKEFLNQKFEEENPELKKRMESPRLQQMNLCKLTDEEIKDFSGRFIDEIKSSRYSFDSFTLGYFVQYSEILANKARKLLSIIEKIGTGASASIAEELEDLDISLDQEGNISKEDMIRLISPTAYVIQELEQKVKEANNLSTYLTFKLSKQSLYKKGIMPGEIFPTRSIQEKSIYGFDYKRCVPLSEKQKKKIREKNAQNMLRWLPKVQKLDD